ncbi:MAG TPA: hypothetical protein VGK93_02670 [Candidatus Eisenbacteria bacterium]
MKLHMRRGGLKAVRAYLAAARKAPNVARVGPRVTWGFGVAAVACLIVNLVA